MHTIENGLICFQSQRIIRIVLHTGRCSISNALKFVGPFGIIDEHFQWNPCKPVLVSTCTIMIVKKKVNSIEMCLFGYEKLYIVNAEQCPILYHSSIKIV